MAQPYVDRWRVLFRREVVPTLPSYVVLAGGRKHRAVIIGVARACADLADFDDGSLAAAVDTIAAAAGVGRKVAMPVLGYLSEVGVVVVETQHGNGTSTRRRLAIGGRPLAAESPPRRTVNGRPGSRPKVPHGGLSASVESPSPAAESPSTGAESPSCRTHPLPPDPPPKSPAEIQVRAVLAEEGEDAQTIDDLIAYALADPATDSPRRLLTSWRSVARRAVDEQRAADRRTRRCATDEQELARLAADPEAGPIVSTLGSSYRDDPGRLLAAVRQELADLRAERAAS